MSVKVVDKGWNDIVKDLKHMNESYTKCGFPSDASLGGGSGSNLKRYSGISEVASVAMFQEFGTKQEATPAQSAYLKSQGFPVNVGTTITNPARPFMSTSFDEGKQKIVNMQEKVYKAVTSQRMNVRQALSILGELGTKLIKGKIRDIKSPALHPFTIKKKGSDKPLIDSGQMLNTVTHSEVIK